jgi:hypothetical protein
MTNKFLFFLLLLTSHAYSQEWHYGPKIDLNLTSMSGKGLQSVLTGGVQAGVFAQRVFNKQWSIQPELLYTGYQVKKASDFMTYYNLNGNTSAGSNIPRYGISIPVLVRYELTDEFSLLAGPQYSYLFFTNENLLRTGEDAFKKSEFSFDAGGQYNTGNVSFSARFSKGISNVNNIDGRYPWRSNHIQIGIAVKIK